MWLTTQVMLAQLASDHLGSNPDDRHHELRPGAVDEAFREAPDHLTFVTELPKAPAGNSWKFTLRDKERA